MASGINFNFTVFDDWGNNITAQTSLQVNVLSGGIRAISYNEPNCQCNSLFVLTLVLMMIILDHVNMVKLQSNRIVK